MPMPIIGRIGGKNYLKHKIVDEVFPDGYENMIYVEPFIGGGSVFFYKNPSVKEIINDADPKAVMIYKGFKKYDNAKIQDEANKLYHTNDKETFEKVKESNPTTEFGKFVKQFIMFKKSFFALGKTFGRKADSKKEGKQFFGYEDNKYKDRLKNTTILQGDYKKTLKYDSNNTLFYFDPPYEMADSSYYDFHKFDYEEFAEICKNIKGYFIVSINDSKNIRNLFKDFNIKSVKTTYSGTKDIESRKVKELVITNYEY